MLELIEAWRQYPTEIEADLLVRGVDIADWHSGARGPRGQLRLSSRRVMAVLEHLPDRSAFKTALRDGDWPEDVQIAAAIHKEQAMYHASKYSTKEYKHKSTVFLSPVERRKRHEEAQEAEQGTEDFYSEMGWT